MRVLIVSMVDSIHTARWVEQISEQGWDIHLFPCENYVEAHPLLKNVTVHHSFYGSKAAKGQNTKSCGIYIPFTVNGVSIPYMAREALKRLAPGHGVRKLKRLIQKLKPDIIHTMEFQHAGYLTMRAKCLIGTWFPKWIATNWGSDIYLFGRLREHIPKIKEILDNCDYYSCECCRDVVLAKDMGFKGKILPVIPNTGGFDIEKIAAFKEPGLTSQRRLILLKGYQHWAGRALVGLRALERCDDMLKGYTVVVYNVFGDDVRVACELFTNSTGIPVKVFSPFELSHEDMLKQHGHARISIGVSISDAISTSLLEGMVMGSFPIQSWTACANEWIEDGKTGILIPPDDPDVIEKAIRRALTDDDLVDRAAEENWKTAIERLDHNKLKAKAVDFYNTVIRELGREKV